MIGINWSVRSKLIAAFGALATAVLAVSWIALYSLSNANARFDRYVHGVNARASMAARIRSAVDIRAIAARNMVLAGNASDLAHEHQRAKEAHADVQANVAELKEAIAADPDSSPKARELVAEIDKVERAYGPVALNIVQSAASGRRDEAIAEMNRACRPLLDELIKASGAYADYTEARAHALVDEAAGQYANQKAVLLGACLMAFLCAVGFGAWITRSLTRALGAEPAVLGEVANRVANGDLSPVTAAVSAPAGSVLSALGRMQAGLTQIVQQVRNSSESIATGTTQIANGNSDLSQRTEEQASNLQQTAASIEELTGTVRNNSETAAKANALASHASQAATAGGDLVDQVVSSMQDIAKSSQQISEIIGVIDGIAFQTNILALNAAVEAARAGEQGRGFAVVAGEVRTLAQRSANAAKEIKTLIMTSAEKVEAGTRQVDSAGRSMADIVAQVQRVSVLIEEISRATAEQTSGIDQVSHAVNRLDHVTQQNAALVEESAAAAESLRIQADQLRQVVATFDLA
ncbi:MAG: methyl-accepting chemotaxis protein [Aquabacterium sp.]|nr:MAG: methyl-accepting chemotaxis protein [Aquabacterium sp.]